MVQKLENVHFSIFGQLKFDIEVLKTLDKHLDKVRKIVVGYTYILYTLRTGSSGCSFGMSWVPAIIGVARS